MSQRRALLACPVSQQEGEERSPTLPLCQSVLSTHYIGLRRRRLRLPLELGAWEACRDRPWVGWEVRQGEVVSGEQTLYLMVLGAEGGLDLADRV